MTEPQNMAYFVILVITTSFMLIGVENVSAEQYWQIAMKEFENHEKKELFTPIELSISSNDTVTWVNYDNTSHKITSGVPTHSDYAGQFFDLGVIKPGESVSKKINYQGYAGYYYFCEIHPWFTGKVFFEDIPEMPRSTIKMESSVFDGYVLVEGITHPDFSKTQYELMIYDSKKHMIFHTINNFVENGTFKEKIDTSSSLWYHDDNYSAKISYGVPSESYEIQIKINQKEPSNEFLDKVSNLCKNNPTEKQIEFDKNTLIPKWYQKSFCWFNDGLISSKEITDAVSYFQKHIF